MRGMTVKVQMENGKSPSLFRISFTTDTNLMHLKAFALWLSIGGEMSHQESHVVRHLPVFAHTSRVPGPVMFFSLLLTDSASM